MTPDERKAARARCEAATPAPWQALCNPERKIPFILTSKGIYDHDLDYEQQNKNNSFIAAARTDLPAALDEIERLEKKLNYVKSFIQRIANQPANNNPMGGLVIEARQVLDQIEEQGEGKCPA